jgi:tetratricopeptide (TPR) repeat protein
MKRLCILLVLAGFPALAGQEMNPPIPALTVNGITYSNVTFGSATPASVTILHRTGIATLPLAAVPPEIQTRFGYDKAKADAFLKADQQARRSGSSPADTGRQTNPGDAPAGPRSTPQVTGQADPTDTVAKLSALSLQVEAMDAMAKKDYVRMLKLAQTMVRDNPRDENGYLWLGIAHSALNSGAEAIEDFRQALKLKPGFALAWSGLGDAYGRAGRIDEAIAAYQQAVKWKPDLATAWANLGVSYSHARRGNEAIAAYQQALKLNPQDALTWYNLGFAYQNAGRSGEASTAFQRARSLNPTLYR